MSRSRFGLVFALVSTLALWGCTQNPNPAVSAKNTKLQDDVKALSAQREQLNKDLASIKDDKQKLEGDLAKLKTTIKEREEQLAARTAERDHSSAQLDMMRKGIKALIEQVDAAAPPSSTSPVGATAAKPANPS